MFQLLPANKAGRSLLFDLSDDDYADTCACKTQLRQVEEDYKYLDVTHSWVHVPCRAVTVALHHFTEDIPVPHTESIPTPPPDLLG
ncbi:MAG: hypothetical protein INR73_12620 [Williamsia sp.]|nr:hypothetical protein [Williamsia sp.]